MKKILILVFIIFAISTQAMAAGVIKEKNGKFGLFDEYSKKQLLPYEYDKITKKEGSYLLVKDGKVGVYSYTYGSPKKEVDLKPLYDDVEKLNSTSYKVKINNKYGIALKGDFIALPIQYDDVFDINELPNYWSSKIYLVKKDNKYAVYDIEEKKFVVPFSLGIDDYYIIRDFNDIFLKKGNKVGLYNVKEDIGFLPKYDEISHLTYQYYLIKSNNKYGIYYYNKVLLPLTYDKIEKDLTFGRVILANGKKQALYDFKKAEFLIPFKYQELSILPFKYRYENERSSNDLYKVKDSSGKFGIYSVKDKAQILPCKYDEINDDFILKKNNKFGLFSNVENKEILPCEYQEIKILYTTKYSVKNNDKYGIYDTVQKTFVLPIEYDKFNNLSCYFEIEKDGKIGVFDLATSKILVPAKYTEISISSSSLSSVITYKAKEGNKFTKYRYDFSGQSKSAVSNSIKTSGIVLGKVVLTPIALVGDVLWDLTPFPLWGYMMSTDENGNWHVFHSFSYSLWTDEMW